MSTLIDPAYPAIAEYYLPHVAATRARLEVDTRVAALLTEDNGSTQMLGFLIEFCALGIRMLRPVEGWLRASGEGCVAAGYEDLGRELIAASTDEAQRHLLLIDDLVQLLDIWRGGVAPWRKGTSLSGGPPRRRTDDKSDALALDMPALVRRDCPESAVRHALIREAASDPSQPYLALGVELELGHLARTLGPRLFRACEAQLGMQVFEGMQYLHSRIDRGALHNDRWMLQLEALLRACPELGPAVAVVGCEATSAMLDFFAECIERGRRIGQHSVYYDAMLQTSR